MISIERYLNTVMLDIMKTCKLSASLRLVESVMDICVPPADVTIYFPYNVKSLMEDWIVNE